MDAASLILAARTQAGISQTELASRLDTHQSVVARWETGKTKPSLETVIRAVEASGLSLNISIGRTAPPERETADVQEAIMELRRLSEEQSRLRWIKGR